VQEYVQKISFTQKLKTLLSKNDAFNDDFYEKLEETLLSADIGFSVTQKLLNQAKFCKSREEVSLKIKEIMKDSLAKDEKQSEYVSNGLEIVVFIGVNGSGKTTALGKMAYQMSQAGKKVYIAAADTFRAAAVEQLKMLASKCEAYVVSQGQGADPSAVVFDAIASAKANGADVLLIDTAGRLHSNDNLMRELEKIIRTINKCEPGAPHRVYLVLDATCGQNALSQAIFFGKMADITGVILNKMDGSAKGGFVFSINAELALPVSFIGYGEKISDFAAFEAESFVDEIFA
jgi:fused signal recognition particle receptor